MTIVNSYYPNPDFNDARLKVLMNESELVSLAAFKEKLTEVPGELEKLKLWISELKNSSLILFTASHSIKISNIYVPDTDEKIETHLRAPTTPDEVFNRDNHPSTHC